jgi:hypothetical protein
LTAPAASLDPAVALDQINRQQLAEELTRLEAEAQRRLWATDPAAWARERLGDTLWSGQETILRAVHRCRRTAIPTCHEVGKSYGAGLLAAWWIDTHKPGEAFVITTAPTAPQVEVILWKEIGRAHQRGSLAGYVNQTDWKIKVGDRHEIVALGRKPSDYAPAAFQGIHAAFVLIIVDEANGVRGPLWDALDSLMANDNSKIVEIGNPDDPSGEFYAHCQPGSGYHVVSISAFDSPNLTGEPLPERIRRELIGRTYIEEKRKKWAAGWYWVDAKGQPCSVERGVRVVPPEDKGLATANPLWYSKVLGEFPENADAGGLIPLSWIKAAQRRTLAAGSPHELGVDVGGGGDATAVCERKGPVYRIRRTDHDPNTMAQCGKVKRDLDTTGAKVAKIDKVGIGWGMVDRGKELQWPFVGINVGEGATPPAPDSDEASADERFLNKRAELWWMVRELFETGNVDIEDEMSPYGDDLAADLCNVRYERRSNGKIQILNKRKNAEGRTVTSPNLGESLMLAAAPVPVDQANHTVTW